MKFHWLSYRALQSSLAVGLIAISGVATACGSSQSSVATETNSAAVTAAEATVAKYSKAPGTISLPKIEKPIPRNLNVQILSVAAPGVEDITNGFVDGAKRLGWTTKLTVPQPTPEAYSSALDSIIRQKPDALLFLTPVPLASFDNQLQQLKREGVVIVTAGAADYPVGGSSPVQADTAGSNVFGLLADVEADTLIAAEKKGPDMAMVVDPSVPAWKTIIDHMKSRIEAAGGKYNEVDVRLADVGTTAPTQIVSYLQGHPDVKYLFLTINAFGIGLQQALQTAGLAGKVFIGTGAGVNSDIVNIENGTINETVVIETGSNGWRLADAMARVVSHASIDCCLHVSSELLIVTKDNLTLANDLTGFPHQTDAFLKAWSLK